MDYAFAPGVTMFDLELKRLFKLRPNTTLVDNAKVARVDQFIEFLKTDASVTRPVDNILIGTHGADAAWMQVQSIQVHPNTTYATLEKAITSGELKIPASLVKTTSFFHIKGCLLGAVPEFIKKQHEALDKTLKVTAPKFYHAAWELPGEGVLEFLSYNFFVSSPTAFSRKNLIAALKAKAFKFENGTAVPDANWEKYIPKAGDKGIASGTDPAVTPGIYPVKHTIHVDPPIKLSNGKQWTVINLRPNMAFAYSVLNYPYIFPVTGTPPTGHAARLALLKTAIGAEPEFDPAKTGFPVYRWYHFNSLTEFIDGFTWVFTWDATNHRFAAAGSLHFYSVSPPVTRKVSSKDQLVFNFYPMQGNPTSLINQLLETDANLFLTV